MDNGRSILASNQRHTDVNTDVNTDATPRICITSRCRCSYCSFVRVKEEVVDADRYDVNIYRTIGEPAALHAVLAHQEQWAAALRPTAALPEGIKAAGGCGSRGSMEIKFRVSGHREVRSDDISLRPDFNPARKPPIPRPVFVRGPVPYVSSVTVSNVSLCSALATK
ncbi:uncharacterized protein LOC122577309 [Bombus pyrosoma]|uniref:uncharacterized protein LOC122577309 n=1 Tax=Bombus pyrosoma TaxID=396416 RepID=UPI001CB8AD92|nr:uncharacterized protein LOC122577309 [Bombus pyrosoma]